MKVNCDLQLTLMASSLYRLLAARVGLGYEVAESRHLFRDLVDATAGITINESELVVRYQEAGAQSVAARRRIRHDRHGDPLAGWQAAAAGLRMTSCWHQDRAWCKVEN